MTKKKSKPNKPKKPSYPKKVVQALTAELRTEANVRYVQSADAVWTMVEVIVYSERASRQYIEIGFAKYNPSTEPGPPSGDMGKQVALGKVLHSIAHRILSAGYDNGGVSEEVFSTQSMIDEVNRENMPATNVNGLPRIPVDIPAMPYGAVSGADVTIIDSTIEAAPVTDKPLPWKKKEYARSKTKSGLKPKYGDNETKR